MADGLTIVGVGRSGTSTATAFAEFAGLRLPHDVLPADQWNPDGYLESSSLIHFNDRLLAASGQTWLKPRRTDRNSVTEYRCIRRAVKAFKTSFGSGPGWVWKDPRLPMLLPFWDQVIGIQPALAPYRDPVSVAASISRRDDVNLDVALAIWERHSRQMLTTVTGRPVLFSDYSHLTERPEAWFRQFFDFCVASGLKVTDADIDFGARIRHIERPAIEKTPTSQQSELAELICSLDGPHENFQPISLPDESPTTQRLIDSVQSPRMAARIRATFTMRPKYVVLASLL
ncbi:hypothetical protein [Mycolicibacterium llatzerense]|uniref:hypothetical protein n=1 Tax=Mycolicibacterium llatzerense TaxID=280871 RepID=UPI0008DCD073|nr:hypothetical protein [Mycolicibacterium llatzerense]